MNLSTYARADLTNAWPGIDGLSADARANEKTVKKALATLIEKGWIRRTRSATGQRPAVYALTFPQRGSEAPATEKQKEGPQTPTTDNPVNEVVGVSVPSSGGLRSEVVGVSVGPDQWKINGEINEKNPRRSSLAEAPLVDVEPTAPTSSDAGLFDIDFSEPIDAELVDEPAPMSAAKPSKPETLEQRVTAAAYERVGKAFKFVAVRGIAKWAIHDRGADPAAVEEALVGVHELGRPITKQTVGQWLDGILSPSGVRPGGMSKQDAKVLGYLETGRRVREQLSAARGAAGPAREDFRTVRELESPPPFAEPVVDPVRDPIAWIDNELPDGFLPGERERASELLAAGEGYSSVRWAILNARNARPKPGLRRRAIVDGASTTTAERTLR